MIDGGALACPDLAACLVTLAVCCGRTGDIRDAAGFGNGDRARPRTRLQRTIP